MKIVDVLDDLFQTGTDGISVVVGIASVEGIEDNGLIGLLFFEISLHHC